MPPGVSLGVRYIRIGCARLKDRCVGWGCIPGVINRSSVVRSKVGNQ